MARGNASSQLSRRSILRAGAATGAAALLASGAPGALAATGTAPRQNEHGQVEPDAGSWRTWVLTSGRQLRPGPPPAPNVARDEVQELAALAKQRDAAALDRIAYWDSGAPGYRWNEIAITHSLKAGLGLFAYRAMALLHVAIYDATVAAWDAKYTYWRPRPSEFNAGGPKFSFQTAIPDPRSPAYPCEHSVAAGAAAAVLGYLFPQDAAMFAAKAAEAAESRLLAGVQHRSDTVAGLALGRAVAELVIARARTDGSDLPWTGTVPVGPGLWSGEPAFPTFGNLKTWVLASGSELRPGPPPAWDSPQRAAEIAEVKNYKRDAFLGSELGFWPEDPAGRPAPDSGPFSSNQAVYYYAPFLHLLWSTELNQKVAEYRLDANPPRAARAYALVNIAGYEASVACWDAKYFYWTARPNQFDPTITTVLPTYPIPDYPSGHSTGLAGTAAVLGYLFPREASFFWSRAVENAASRLWAGIHFRSACEGGLALGRAVADRIIARARADGAD
jgi:membrane-associated phospholipid phosphatase